MSYNYGCHHYFGNGRDVYISDVPSYITEDNFKFLYGLPSNTWGAPGQALITDGVNSASWETITGGATTLDTSLFNNRLSIADDTVQKMANTVDEMIPASVISTDWDFLAASPLLWGSANQVLTTNGVNALSWSTMTGANTTLNTGFFNNLLSAADDTVQKMADTIDDFPISFTNPNSIRIGNLSTAGLGDKNIVIGYGSGLSTSTGYENIILGRNSGKNITTGYFNLIMGTNMAAGILTGIENIVLGAYSNCSDNSAQISVGTRTQTNTLGDISIGYETTSTGGWAVCIGSNSNANGGNSVCIGRAGNAALQAVCIGDTAQAINSASISVGLSANSSGVGSTSIGWEAVSSGQVSISIGRQASTNSMDSVSIGPYTSCTAAYGLTLGSSSNCSIAAGISIGTMITNSGGWCVGYGSTILLRDVAFGFDNMAYTTHAAGNEGWDNTAMGYNAMKYLSSGYNNTAIGSYSLAAANASIFRLTGHSNTVFGKGAMENPTPTADITTSANVAVGVNALRSCQVGSYNTCMGYEAGLNINSASGMNTVIGASAAPSLITRISNVVVGYRADCGEFDNQLVIGGAAISNNNNTVCLGVQAVSSGLNAVSIGMTSNTSATGSIAVGAAAAASATSGICIGYESACSGTYGIALGDNADASNNAAISIGQGSTASGNTSICIGKSSTCSGTVGVCIGYSLSNTDGIMIGGWGGVCLTGDVIVGMNSCLHSTHTIGNTGWNNTCIGYEAGMRISSGYENTAVGYYALQGNIASDTYKITGAYNTVMGTGAMRNATPTADISGNYNTSIGHNTFPALQSGSANAGLGVSTAVNLVSGNGNIILGINVAPSLTTASNNICIGNAADINNSSYQISMGQQASTSADYAISVGYQAASTAQDAICIGRGTSKSRNGVSIGYLCYSGTQSSDAAVNIGIGYKCGVDTGMTGGGNIGIGMTCLENAGSDCGNNIGIGNNALGDGALTGNGINVGIGVNTLKNLTSGTQNVGLGYDAGGALTTGSYNTMIGSATSANSVSATYCVSIGNYANSYILNSVAIGAGNSAANAAQCDGTNSVAVGSNSFVSAEGTGLGESAEAGGRGVSVGRLAKAGYNGIAIGYNITAIDNQIYMGNGSTSSVKIMGLNTWIGPPAATFKAVYWDTATGELYRAP